MNVTSDEFEYISLMLNHVTVIFSDGHMKHVHQDMIPQFATAIDGRTDRSFADCINALKAAGRRAVKRCTCKAHVKYYDLKKQKGSLSRENFQFYILLGQLQQFDISKELKDQTGAQMIVDLYNFITSRVTPIVDTLMYCKATHLQTSCVVYDMEKGTTNLYNATPDFMAKLESKPVAVGEIEPSMFTQMVVAALGQLSNPLVKYSMGVVISHSRAVDLYWIVKEPTIVMQTGEEYCGPVKFKKMSSASYNITNKEQLEVFLKKLIKGINFIGKDYDSRVGEEEEEVIPRISERISDPKPKRAKLSQ